MRELDTPDVHHLNAASGWADLGNLRESRLELGRISAASRVHPDVLELRWRIEAGDYRWAASLAAAEELVQADPENPSGWIHRSYSLHELKRTAEARDCLLAVVDKFKGIPTIPYNLACYTCQLGELSDARVWLKRAALMLGKKDLKQLAAADRDLLPLRKELDGL